MKWLYLVSYNDLNHQFDHLNKLFNFPGLSLMFDTFLYYSSFSHFIILNLKESSHFTFSDQITNFPVLSVSSFVSNKHNLREIVVLLCKKSGKLRNKYYIEHPFLDFIFFSWSYSLHIYSSKSFSNKLLTIFDQMHPISHLVFWNTKIVISLFCNYCCRN